jgi:hypothetical protein
MAASKVTTTLVMKEVKNFAANHGVVPKKVDVIINDIITEYYEDSENAEAKWLEFDSTNLHKLEDEEFLSDENISIRQKYELSLGKKEPNEDFDLHMVFGTNKTKTKLAVLIKKNSILTVNDDLADNIVDEINKERIKSGYLLDVWDEQDIRKKVNTLVVSISENGKMLKDIQIPISSVLGPKYPVNDKLVYHYKHKDDDKPKKDGLNFIGVNKEELLIEYVKPKDGKAGRNCKGEIIPVAKPVCNNEPKFDVGPNIRKEEDENAIKYIANADGVISFENGVYDVSNSMDFDKLDFKETGSIKAGLDTGVTLNIEEEDPMKDAIGTGIEVEVTEINLVGNVAKDTKLSARKMVIKGQVHNDSELSADEAEIDRLKGFLKAQDAHILNLENGTVYADSVKIDFARGGEVHANTIDISDLKSNTILMAKDNIVIQNIIGDNNKIIITPYASPEIKEDIEKIKSDIEEFNKELHFTGKSISDYRLKIRDNNDKYNELKAKMDQYKQEKKEIPAIMMTELEKMEITLRQDQKMEEKLNKRDEDIKKLRSYDASLYNAKIEFIGDYSGFNTVIFKYCSVDDEIEINPQDGVSEVYLEHIDGDKDRIVQV